MARSIFSFRHTLALVAFLSAPANSQEVAHPAWTSDVIVPQSRGYSMGRHAAVKIEQVRAGVVIRGQAATTMLEIRLRNPSPDRLEAELLMPVPDGAVVRGFSYAGSSREPSARVLPKDEARRHYDGLVAQARDPALLEFAGYQPRAIERLPGRWERDAGRPADLRAPAVVRRRSNRLRPAPQRVGRVSRALEDQRPDRRGRADRGRVFAEPQGPDDTAPRRTWRRWSWTAKPRPTPARSASRTCASRPGCPPRCSPIPTPASAAATSCCWPACRRPPEGERRPRSAAR